MGSEPAGRPGLAQVFRHDAAPWPGLDDLQFPARLLSRFSLDSLSLGRFSLGWLSLASLSLCPGLYLHCLGHGHGPIGFACPRELRAKSTRRASSRS